MTTSARDDVCLGVDLGSRRVKVALVQGGLLRDWKSFNTPAFYRLHTRPREAVQADEFAQVATGHTGGEAGGIDSTGGAGAPLSIPSRDRGATRRISVDFEELGFTGYDRMVSTGYGRDNLAVEGATVVSEVLAHAAGAAAQSGLSDFVNLDMGGQDFKITLVREGYVSDMSANPRCAASSGRFLETMADVLDMGLDELARYHEDPLPIDSTCSVFAETEVVGLLAEGYPVERIAAGVNRALIRKLLPFAGPMVSKVDTVVFTGGCARSGALKLIVAEELGKDVVVPEHPEANGAFGCCLVEL